MSTKRLLWPAFLLPFVLGGCFLPFAAVAPPMRVSAGTGGMIGPTNTASSPPLAPLPFHFQLSVMPMQAAPKFYRRRFDFGLGFQFLHDNRHLASVFSPLLEGSFILWQEPLNPEVDIAKQPQPGRRGWSFGLTRVALTMQVQLPIVNTWPNREVGFGTTLRVSGEFLSFVNGRPKGGCSSSRGGFFCASGTSWGEFGLGLYFEGTYMTVMGRHYGVIAAGITVRFPTTAIAGFALVMP